jgi:hypothetical protein
VITAWIGDLGVEVLHELRDRHVHDGLVEDHQELRGGQDHQNRRSALRHRGASFRRSAVVRF